MRGILILILFLTSINCSAQVKNLDFYQLMLPYSLSPQKNNISNNKIKKEVRFLHNWRLDRMDSIGTPILIIYYDTLGNVLERKQIIYDPSFVVDTIKYHYRYSDNYKTRETWVQFPNSLGKKENITKYDEYDRVIEDQYYDYRMRQVFYKYNAIGKLISKTEDKKTSIYEFNFEGNPFKWTYYAHDTIFGSEKYIYDEQGNLKERLGFDKENGNFYKMSIFQYDAYNNLNEETLYSYDPWKTSNINIINGKIQYEYNSKNNLTIKRIFSIREEVYKLDHEYTYNYNENGILLEQTEDKKLSYKTTIKHNYEYFE